MQANKPNIDTWIDKGSNDYLLKLEGNKLVVDDFTNRSKYSLIFQDTTSYKLETIVNSILEEPPKEGTSKEIDIEKLKNLTGIQDNTKLNSLIGKLNEKIIKHNNSIGHKIARALFHTEDIRIIPAIAPEGTIEPPTLPEEEPKPPETSKTASNEGNKGQAKEITEDKKSLQPQPLITPEIVQESDIKIIEQEATLQAFQEKEQLLQEALKSGHFTEEEQTILSNIPKEASKQEVCEKTQEILSAKLSSKKTALTAQLDNNKELPLPDYTSELSQVRENFDSNQPFNDFLHEYTTRSSTLTDLSQKITGSIEEQKSVLSMQKGALFTGIDSNILFSEEQKNALKGSLSESLTPQKIKALEIEIAETVGRQTEKLRGLKNTLKKELESYSHPTVNALKTSVENLSSPEDTETIKNIQTSIEELKAFESEKELLRTQQESLKRTQDELTSQLQTMNPTKAFPSIVSSITQRIQELNPNTKDAVQQDIKTFQDLLTQYNEVQSSINALTNPSIKENLQSQLTENPLSVKDLETKVVELQTALQTAQEKEKVLQEISQNNIFTEEELTTLLKDSMNSSKEQIISDTQKMLSQKMNTEKKTLSSLITNNQEIPLENHTQSLFVISESLQQNQSLSDLLKEYTENHNALILLSQKITTSIEEQKATLTTEKATLLTEINNSPLLSEEQKNTLKSTVGESPTPEKLETLKTEIAKITKEQQGKLTELKSTLENGLKQYSSSIATTLKELIQNLSSPEDPENIQKIQTSIEQLKAFESEKEKLERQIQKLEENQKKALLTKLQNIYPKEDSLNWLISQSKQALEEVSQDLEKAQKEALEQEKHDLLNSLELSEEGKSVSNNNLDNLITIEEVKTTKTNIERFNTLYENIALLAEDETKKQLLEDLQKISPKKQLSSLNSDDFQARLILLRNKANDLRIKQYTSLLEKSQLLNEQIQEIEDKTSQRKLLKLLNEKTAIFESKPDLWETTTIQIELDQIEYNIKIAKIKIALEKIIKEIDTDKNIPKAITKHLRDALENAIEVQELSDVKDKIEMIRDYSNFKNELIGLKKQAEEKNMPQVSRSISIFMSRRSLKGKSVPTQLNRIGAFLEQGQELEKRVLSILHPSTESQDTD